MGESCSIVARCRDLVTDKLTNKVSQLHRDLLGLGKIAQHFDRLRANKLLYLSRSKKFLDRYNDELIFDSEEANREPIIASLYEIAKGMMPEVTLKDMRELLADKYKEGVYDYQEAYDKMLEFNKTLQGSHLFMGTLDALEDGKYKFRIAYNAVEEQDALIRTISDKRMAENIITKLEKLGVAVSEGVRSLYRTKGAIPIIKGLKGIIEIKGGAYNNVKDLSSETGHFVIASLGNDHPIVQRLFNAIQKNPALVKELLGTKEYEKYLGTPNQDREFAGHLVGLYLELYDSIEPKSFLQKIGHLIQRAIDWCAAHIPFRNNDYNQALYDAKYAAYSLAKDFMGENFQGSLERALNVNDGQGEELFGDTNQLFADLRSIIKDFDLIRKESKRWGRGTYKNFDKQFKRLMEAIQNLEADKKAASVLAEDEADTIEAMEKRTGEAVATLLKFLESEIAKAQTRLEWAIVGYAPVNVSTDPRVLTVNEKALIISLNQKILDMCMKVLKLKDSFMESIGGENPIVSRLEHEFDILTQFTMGIKLTIGKPEMVENNYMVAIHKARLAMATQLLTLINGAQFLTLSKHVSINSFKDFFRGNIAKQNKYLNLLKLLESTDINPSSALWSRYIDSMADSPDIINQMVYDLVEQKKHEANIATLEYKDRLKALYDDLRKSGIRNTDIFFEQETVPSFINNKKYKKGDIIKIKRKGDIDVDYYEFTENFQGNINDAFDVLEGVDIKDVPQQRRSGNLVSDRNWGDWERLWEEHRKIFNDNYYEKHKDENLFASRSEMYSNASYLVAFGAFSLDWHSKYSTKLKVEDPDNPGEYLKDSEGKYIEKLAPKISKDFKNPEDAKNAEFLFDSDQFANLKPEAREWLLKYLELKRELDRKVPSGATNIFGLRAPQFTGTITNSLLNVFLGPVKASRVGNMTLRHFITYNISNSPDDVEYGGDNNTYDADEVYAEDGSIIFDTAHANALLSIERLPLYGIKKFKGNRIDDLSTDLVHSTLAYAAMACSYESLSDIVDAIEETANLLKGRKVNNDFAMNALREVDLPSSYGRLQDYIKQLVYNKYSDQQKSTSYILRRKLTSKLARLGSLYFLGWNFHSAATNVFTGFREIFKEATGGEEFTIKEFALANCIFFKMKLQGIGSVLSSFTEPGSLAESRTKLALLGRHMDILNENKREFRNLHIDTPGWSLFKGYSYSNIALWPYSATDEWMQTIPVLASALHTKLKNKETGEIKSLWNAYEVIEDPETKQPKIQPIGGYDNWLVKDKNLENLQSMLKEEESLLPEGESLSVDKLNAIYQSNDLGFLTDDEGNRILKDTWIPWDTLHENRFRIRARGINNRLHGVYNTGDGGAYEKFVLGAAVASLKKYAIGLIDRRFSRARYDFRIQDYRQGSYVTMLNLFSDCVFGTRQTSNNKIVNALDGIQWSDSKYTALVYKPLVGLLKFAFITCSPSIFTKEYLQSRGFNENQIANISRFWSDMMEILILKVFLRLTAPEDDDDEDFWTSWIPDNLPEWMPLVGGTDLKHLRLPEWEGLANAEATAYSWILQNFPFIELAPEDYTLTKAHMEELGDKEGQIPFSQRAIMHYQLFRGLIEAEAYNPATFVSMFGELKTLSSNNIPFLGALMDMYSLVLECSEHKTVEDLKEMSLEADSKQEEDAIWDKYYNPLGKEIYVRGDKKGYYKYAKHLLRTSIFRTPEMHMFGYKSKESMVFWRGAGLGIDE